jgi:hypothetical protein
MSNQQTRARRILVSILDFCGGLGGVSIAAGAILRLALASAVSLIEILVLFTLIVGGLGLFVVPSWRKPRIVFGTLFTFFMIISIVAAMFLPDLHRVATL